ncbi:hypothetical protein [Chondrinema litorale]|uniref:hypothetical protein n=1 Tax=Chondrinema litorale TaxID=2994555 RepID=UPI002543EA86|nr:hypothetical protein [Chondrinema litorale]UZR98707.1 hypothetical protein OQ292_32375 [Chondrinema litorale]
MYHPLKPMIFLIDKVDSEYQVIVYKGIFDLTHSIEWQDIFEGKSLIIDEHGVGYEWDSSKSDEIGIVYDYTMISTLRISDLITQCLKKLNADKDIYEFNFFL